MSPRKGFSVRASGVDSAVSQLPNLQPWSAKGMGDIDVLIASRGFEDRVCAFPRELAGMGARLRGAVVLGKYRTNEIENDRMAEELMPLLHSISSGLIVECDAEIPSEIRSTISSALDSIPRGAACHVLLDVSACSSTFEISSLLALASARRPIKLSVLYATAESYHEPSLEARQMPAGSWGVDHQREVGVSDVSTNELQRGLHHDHLPGFAIVTPSMFTARLQRCLGHLGIEPGSSEDQEIFWILPSTTAKEHEWRQGAVAHAVDQLISVVAGDGAIERDATSFGFCDALDYKECVRLVMTQIEKQAGSNVSMIHMGTKMQALGVSIALAARPEVALVHARPNSFAADSYSKGVGTLRMVVFEDFHQSIKGIADVGSLTVVPR